MNLIEHHRQRPLLLASVASAEEASVALACGADIIDAKNPAAGALGALPHPVIEAIVAAVAGRTLVSATIGDLPERAGIKAEVAERTAAAGVDFVKVGFFGDGDPRASVEALGAAALGRARLIAVLMADRAPDFSILPILAANGFAGVMLDTAEKARGTLAEALAPAKLADFVREARTLSLMSGLAGSLRIVDVEEMSLFGSDVLGFRGALCNDGRKSGLDAGKARALRACIDAVRVDPARMQRSVA